LQISTQRQTTQVIYKAEDDDEDEYDYYKHDGYDDDDDKHDGYDDDDGILESNLLYTCKGVPQLKIY